MATTAPSVVPLPSTPPSRPRPPTSDVEKTPEGITASVGKVPWAEKYFQDVAPEVDEVKVKVLDKKRRFHTGRPLELKNLPEGCTEQDIRNAFPDLKVVSVSIERNDGRYKPGARLLLENPEVLDEWPKSRENVFVKNKEVSVCVGNSDGWLCVAKLPPFFTEEQFLKMAAGYGMVRTAFLMISEVTGESKAYGLIRYESSDAAAQARHLLNTRSIAGYDIECDWLNSAHITFKSLHSKALYVDHLPKGYRDMDEFRKTFSIIRKPPYCQIAMPKGVIQDWGLVEFFDPQDTEDTQRKLHGHFLKGHRVRVHFCIPGVNAINIYMQAVNAPPDNRKRALMNDTPSANVYSQLQKLAHQNPSFAQNLQRIIQEQIHTLTTGSPPPPSETTPEPSSEAASATNQNSNAMAALMILLTAQMQEEEANLLQNPQVVGVLENLVDQASDPASSSASLNEILKNPALNSVFGGPESANDAEVSKIVSSPPPIVANNLNNLLNPQNLKELLGSLDANSQSTSVVTTTTSNPIPPMPPVHSSATSIPLPRPILMGNPNTLVPPVYSTSMPPPMPPTIQGFPGLPGHLPGLFYPPATSLHMPPPPLPNPIFNSYGLRPTFMGLTLPPAGFPPNTFVHSLPTQAPPVILNPSPVSDTSQQMSSPQSYYSSSPSPYFDSTPGGQRSSDNATFSTPPPYHRAGNKRKLPIPPSPEQSPEGPYIGQHSQGLGGHYADSYWRKKKKFY